MDKELENVTILDIRSDYGFKRFFSDKVFAESFINSVLSLEGDDAITIRNYLDVRLSANVFGIPNTFVDILVETGKGEHIIFEMQRHYHEGLDKRCCYYVSRDFSDQLKYCTKYVKPKRAGYINLPKTHIIAVFNFDKEFLKGKDFIASDEFPKIESDNYIFDTVF